MKNKEVNKRLIVLFKGTPKEIIKCMKTLVSVKGTKTKLGDCHGCIIRNT